MLHPRIIVTMGDPGGVGPEVCLQLLLDHNQYAGTVPIIFGDAAILRQVAHVCGYPEPKNVVPFHVAMDLHSLKEATVVDFGTIDPSTFQHGKVTAEGGEASYQYFITAIDFVLAGKADGITTGPINKEALHAAKHFYPGHTEILIERCGRDTGCMMLTSEELTCSFVTTHVGYRDVPQLLTVERIGEVIDLTVEAMRKIRKREPRLLVCGLNPHAGEHGLFGDREEERIIVPAVEAARARGIHIDGPVPPDTAFLAERRPLYDCVICMYHDQGHIPLKALAFDVAVNTTLGLPIVRTSVDHGTAFDIAWQGKAKVSSMIHAVQLARDLVSHQEANPPITQRLPLTLTPLRHILNEQSLVIAIALSHACFTWKAVPMNRLRRFITWGLTLAIFVSCGAASLPGAALLSSANLAAHSQNKNTESHSLQSGASRLPGAAIRHEAEASGPQVVERLQSQVADCQLPGSGATIEVIEPLCLLQGRIRYGDSLQSLKTRWQV